MNLRCGFCQTPYALGRTEILAALQHLEQENLTHYDAHCPRCRRATPILRQKLEMAMPNWKEELKEAVNQPAPAQQAKEEKPAAAETEKAAPKPTSKEKSIRQPATKAKSENKKATPKAPAKKSK
jgi:hypothetical protein